MIHWLTTGEHWQLLAAICTVMAIVGGFARKGWRKIKSAWEKGRDAFWERVADQTTVAAAQVASPIVEAQERTQRAVLRHLKECSDDRAQTRRRVGELEKSVIELAGRTPARK
jgi:hypothetical protein